MPWKTPALSVHLLLSICLSPTHPSVIHPSLYPPTHPATHTLPVCPLPPGYPPPGLSTSDPTP